jgi:hypothetical protein
LVNKQKIVLDVEVGVGVGVGVEFVENVVVNVVFGSDKIRS